MIELDHDRLVFSFPEVHDRATCSVEFQRTLRIPDDGREYPLPAGLGQFPLIHVDDYAPTVPKAWRSHGGVLMPMYQTEALWVNFSAAYPFAVKVAAGMIDAVTGGTWDSALHFGRSPSHTGSGPVQDYLVLPEQPWLDGFNVQEGQIRQFVAMPLGRGYTAEEQLTGQARFGGVQLVAYPMKAEAYERWRGRHRVWAAEGTGMMMTAAAAPSPEMGLGAGGLMRQQIFADPHSPDVWDLAHASRCYVHLANSVLWAAITGEAPPTLPPTSAQYRAAGIPWFDYAAGGEALPGSPVLRELDTVAVLARARGELLPDNDPIPVDRVRRLRRLRTAAVSEFPDWT